jgi:hypothetical protein
MPAPGHKIWAYYEQLRKWQAQGLNRYDMKDRLEKLGLVVGVDTIRAVLDSGPVMGSTPMPEAVARPQRKLKMGDFYPCGRPVEISNRNNKKHGWVAGEAKPCECLLCGPVENRIRQWAHWTTHGYYGYYLCVGVPAVTVGCDRMRVCAGPSPEQMICRECFEIPPAVVVREPVTITRKAQ